MWWLPRVEKHALSSKRSDIVTTVQRSRPKCSVAKPINHIAPRRKPPTTQPSSYPVLQTQSSRPNPPEPALQIQLSRSSSPDPVLQIQPTRPIPKVIMPPAPAMQLPLLPNPAQIQPSRTRPPDPALKSSCPQPQPCSHLSRQTQPRPSPPEPALQTQPSRTRPPATSLPDAALQ
ncbi:anther-specific proline-rich protein APG-like isoform X2 [Salmo trutta]|uniref:anther-specific proline-rich protein APG-like isoform X2 n=1 Tax=Salmo trutta TaxID=8032 RepID=UPI0011322BD8|nr:anther-specific proline-rich protein APG-like isoform X2 [Salmo trutta]